MSSSKVANGAKSKWDEEAHKAMVGALLDVLDDNSVSLRKEPNQATLMASMEQRGMSFTFEAMRSVHIHYYHHFMPLHLGQIVRLQKQARKGPIGS